MSKQQTKQEIAVIIPRAIGEINGEQLLRITVITPNMSKHRHISKIKEPVLFRTLEKVLNNDKEHFIVATIEVIVSYRLRAEGWLLDGSIQLPELPSLDRIYKK